jgi:hypothetical protein
LGPTPVLMFGSAARTERFAGSGAAIGHLLRIQRALLMDYDRNPPIETSASAQDWRLPNPAISLATRDALQAVKATVACAVRDEPL